ncbi:hypothetical protein GRF29_164g763970 [Pseudopithomyces chartarum]|uniref:Uncharacterized protein n=1 Tax=Pseudopithomyces chartarum TaxID=1892770 RepID=A0AAN6RFA9_9PLEO|nr:hypothetical protein GRF29_164g763970 [Pseudopithomyces chartarum]
MGSAEGRQCTQSPPPAHHGSGSNPRRVNPGHTHRRHSSPPPSSFCIVVHRDQLAARPREPEVATTSRSGPSLGRRYSNRPATSPLLRNPICIAARPRCRHHVVPEDQDRQAAPVAQGSDQLPPRGFVQVVRCLQALVLASHACSGHRARPDRHPQRRRCHPMAGIDNGLLAPPTADAKGKKGRPGPKAGGAGTKRAAAAIDGTPKVRGKPGPKKKQRMGDMINDPNSKGPFPAAASVPKLGPKANMGTINANLRALDRSGKPCRKWGKKTFQVRSFTGVIWDVPTWRAPPKSAAFAEDVKSDSTGSTDSKIKDESSAISDRSGMNGDASTPIPPPLNGIASSPTPLPAVS